MAIQRKISLDDQETAIKKFLVGAAELYGQTNGGRTPILRFAGGWVRDKLLGNPSKDIDVAIDNMSGKEFYQALQAYASQQASDEGTEHNKTLGKLGEIKKDAEKSKHLETATTKLFGLELDLVNLRTETYDEVSRNPIMEMGTAEEDAQRRDATINAMFYNLNTGEVEDLTGQGFKDLETKMIRTPLDPEKTFRDDPLRILRLIRFACRFGFEIDEKALHWMEDTSIQAALEKKISRERILVELEKTLKGPAPARALQIILDRGLYNTIFTIPDYEDGVVKRVSTSRLEALLVRDAEGQQMTRVESVVNLICPRTVEERWWLWLICAVMPWFGQEMPAAIVKKGAPTTMAARVARDSLKLDNNSLKVVNNAENHVTEVRKMVGQHSIKEGGNENSDSSRKRQCVTWDRVQAGLAIRKWGESWRCVAAAGAMHELSQAMASQAQVLTDYSAWLDFVRQEGLDEVWNSKSFKTLLDGKEIFGLVRSERPDVTRGPWMSAAVDLVAEYQLRENTTASKKGAERFLLGAIRDKSLNLDAASSKKK